MQREQLIKPNLIVSDIDGTILDETERLPRNILELKTLIHKHRLPFTIASGREYSSIAFLAEELEVKLPIITCNGAACIQQGNYIWSEAISITLVEAIIRKVDNMGLTVIMNKQDGEFSYRKTEFVEQTIRTHGRFGSVCQPKKGEWPRAHIHKLLIINPYTAEMTREVIDYLNMFKNEIDYIVYGDKSIDIMPKGTSKLSGIHRLTSYLQVDVNRTMAVGDSFNDIEMISNVGIGVAVGNAKVNVKAVADYVCTEEYINGVIEAINKYCI